jgi:hypothetical protein
MKTMNNFNDIQIDMFYSSFPKVKRISGIDLILPEGFGWKLAISLSRHWGWKTDNKGGNAS